MKFRHTLTSICSAIPALQGFITQLFSAFFVISFKASVMNNLVGSAGHPDPGMISFQNQSQIIN
jgi:hypothetical protein